MPARRGNVRILMRGINITIIIGCLLAAVKSISGFTPLEMASMRTFISGLIAAALFAATLTAGDDGVAGNWKVIILEESQLANPWLIRVENKAGKWSGAAEGLKGMPATKL